MLFNACPENQEMKGDCWEKKRGYSFQIMKLCILGNKINSLILHSRNLIIYNQWKSF